MDNNKLIFEKANYLILIVGIVVIFSGFIIMFLDSEPYGFGFLGITLGPIVVLSGFVIEFFAIFFKKKK